MFRNKPVISDQDVRVRAYRLWEKNGRPEGQADEYWREALKELEAEFCCADKHTTPDQPTISTPPTRSAAAAIGKSHGA